MNEGTEFADAEHLYAADLDLFGHGSLFQILCSARTQAGRETLASWMKEPAGRDEALLRRAAITELVPRTDLRERFATAGTLYFSNCRPETFRAWNDELVSQGAFPAWLPVAGILLVIAVLLQPIWYFFGNLDATRLWVNMGVLFSVEGALAWTFRKRVRFILATMGPLSVEIPLVCDLLALIEKEQFSSQKFADLASPGLPQSGWFARWFSRTPSGF